MFTRYRTQGIVIKSVDRGEADQLFTVYTKDFGRLDVLAKGIRKMASKLRSGIEFPCYSQIEFIQGKTYKTLTDALMADKYRALRSDAQRLDTALRVTNLIDRAVREQQSDPKVWNLAQTALRRLESGAVHDSRAAYHCFFWNLAAALGWKPEIEKCCCCAGETDPRHFLFSSGEGGIVCPRCAAKADQPRTIGADIVAIINIFLHKKASVFSRLRLTGSHAMVLDSLEKEYLGLRIR